MKQTLDMTHLKTAAGLTLLFFLSAFVSVACDNNDTTDSNTTTTVDTGDTPNTGTNASTATVDAKDTPNTGNESNPPDNATESEAMRCQANQDAGTVTFVTGFDYAASAGIIDAIVADAQGYFKELCIDFAIQPGFSPSNGALVIANQAQFGVAGSFGELVNNNIAGEGDLVAVLHWGRTAINAIVVPAGTAIEDFTELCGHKVGIKGDLPYSLQAAVALAGIERSCFEEVRLTGFDPVFHLELGIDALPVYKSNEPYTLRKENIEFTMLDPIDFEVPASFGITFTTQSFIDEHPGLAQDVVRALIRGQAFAAENPDIALENAFELIEAAGNPRYLAMEAESHRWRTESSLISDLTPNSDSLGVPDLKLLEAEIEALTQAGVFDELPDWRSMVNAEIAASVHEDTETVWQ